MIEALLERFAVDPRVAAAGRRAAGACEGGRERAAARATVSAQMLAAFAAEGVADSDLAATYGYGYDDRGRERYDSLLRRIFGTESAFARLSLVSGTQAITATIEACTPADGRVIAAAGRPYDTLRNALVDAPHSLARRGARYDEIPLADDGGVDHGGLERACRAGVDVVLVQRSRGYAARRSLSARECGEVARTVKRAAPQALVLVDNCYGELVEPTEPTHHGADAVMGSLIKNLGGGIAPGGAYVAGRRSVVERVAARHYAPGLGTALGPSFGLTRALLQGLFAAPQAVTECLAGLDFAAALFSELGEEVHPPAGAPRYDIVQAIRLGSRQRLLAFARGLQRAMPVNARFAPEPGDVPGYREPVVMSAGAFIPGATIELSCDAPLRPPFEVYLQGGTSRSHGMLGALLAADSLAAC
ncbi:MAG: methionine gamma-lyase family protein [Candidatus Eremiobacteraeota bacterium]|nr:methionine gamma-lyase family protein [Candidatus Eremiobacteraeota bacterium]MBC5804270.1 methionine gamma-lyase family protein [Candidatus Eremiobacteraeota bacterium]MBC5821109.1 methionine gamma-lyase family protein [Candidatus Eremiobacteraeota bacterium]